jgi:hypothetical protein
MGTFQYPPPGRKISANANLGFIHLLKGENTYPEVEALHCPLKKIVFMYQVVAGEFVYLL